MLLDMWPAATFSRLRCKHPMQSALWEAACCSLQLFCTLQTSEAERIGVNQVAKVHPTGNPSGTEQRECLCRLCCYQPAYV